jgi:hypothetical protein
MIVLRSSGFDLQENAMQRQMGLLLAVLILFAVGPRAIPSGTEASAFDQLKSLVGEWEGTSREGPVKITYTLVSNSTALMERLQRANEPEMITMYSLDGDRILVTHYCSAGNQPQMKSEAMKGKAQKYSFSLVRVSGLKSEDEGHMIGLVLTILDNDHLTQEWTYQEKGKTAVDLFQYKRKLEKPATVVPTRN